MGQALTDKQRELAAQMIEKRGFSLDGDTDTDTLAAAAFVFDEGILFLNDKGRQQVVEMLREKAP